MAKYTARKSFVFLCNDYIGGEFHYLFICKSQYLSNLREKLTTRCPTIRNGSSILPTTGKEELVGITRDNTSSSGVGSDTRWCSNTPKVELMTPVTQTLEMAKSELAREKVVRGKKRKRSFN